MKRIAPPVFVVVVSVIALMTASTTLAAPERPTVRPGVSEINERIGAGTLAFDFAGDFDRALLMISGPRGTRVRKEFGPGETLAVSLAGKAGEALPNGRYTYILRLSPRSAKTQVKSGTFFVENGAAVARESKREELSKIRGDLNSSRRELGLGARKKQKPAGAQQGARPPRDPAAPPRESLGAYGYLTLYGYPFFFPYYGPYFQWYSYVGFPYYTFGGTAFQAHYGFDPYNYNYGFFQDINIGDRVEFSYIGSNLAYAIYGDIVEIAYGGGHYGYEFYGGKLNYSTFGQTQFVGYGNTLAYAFGYANNGVPYYGGNHTLFGASYDPGFAVYNASYLTVTPVGVGIQTYYPTADLEIYDYDFAAVRLYSGLGAAKWAFMANPVGQFSVNLIGSGGQELSVNPRFDAAGPTMDVQGSVRGTQFIASSSRDMKTDFVEVDGKEILSKLAEVPVMKWRYKTEDQDASHFGPVAEDFRAAFELGDGQHISNVDADGVALAAIQGLQAVVQENRAELLARLADKDREIAELRRRLAEIEKRLKTPAPGS